MDINIKIYKLWSTLIKMFKKGDENYSRKYGSWNKGIKGNEFKKHYLNGIKGFKKGHKMNIGRKHSQETKLKQREKKLRNGHISKDGYRMLSYLSKRYLEHQFIWCEANNMCFIPPGAEIHHLNGNKIDNRPENLVLLDKSTHAQLHWMIEKNNNINRFKEEVI